MSSRRVGLLLVLSTLVVIAVVLVVVLTGGDDGSGRTLRGDATRNYPLRGSLADDTKAIDGAVAAWRDADDPQTTPDRDEDVAVLWIGALDGGEQVAVLAGDRHLAEVTRRGDGDWAVQASVYDAHPYATDRPLAVGRSMVEPAGDGYYYRAFGPGPELKEHDGLFHEGARPARGLLWPFARGMSATDAKFVYAFGVGEFGVDKETLGQLHLIASNPQAVGFWSALQAADTRLDAMGATDPDAAQWLRIQEHDAYVFEVVALSLERPNHIAFTVGHDDEGVVLGSGDTFGTQGLAAAGSIEVDDEPYLVWSGFRAKRITALVGDQRLTRDGPFHIEGAGRKAADGVLAPIRAVDGPGVKGLAPNG